MMLKRFSKSSNLFVALILMGGPIASELPGETLKALLEPLIRNHRGEVSVMVQHPASGEEYSWQADTPRPAASLIKVATMVTAYQFADRNRLDLDQAVVLNDQDKVPGSGVLTENFTAGLQISVRDLIRLMIRYSDNTATNLVVDQIGLPSTTQAMDTIGLTNTRLHSKVHRGSESIAPERSQRFGLGSTTARETVALLKAVLNEEAAKAESCAAMIEHLMCCEDDTMLARKLPPSFKFAHKSGAISHSRCDAGIMMFKDGPVLICVLTTNNEDKSWTDDNEAQLLCAEIGRLVYDHFQTDSGDEGETQTEVLQRGAIGSSVEMLQRTLNSRLEPSPNLSVDGDFGPATEAAVKQFQFDAGVPVTGRVDRAFWARLGPVVPSVEVEKPDVVNGRVLPKAERDALKGLPFVTCPSWIICDGDTGRPLWQANANDARHTASTTKIMTAWLVLKAGEENPEIFGEQILFSRRADETPGSTSGLKEGESVSVKEALYGLLLPSGNDMSVALAEHFGKRFVMSEQLKNVDELDPVQAFVMAMNHEAKRLEMDSTTYTNPHGLSEKDHLSTAGDLAKLAFTALGNPMFADYVSTRERGVVVRGSSGYQRNVIWKNTNQLLAIQGYEGVKTGTTSKAGACLASVCFREDRKLLLVVLGSSSSSSRYTDSRNLYRWAWLNLTGFNDEMGDH